MHAMCMQRADCQLRLGLGWHRLDDISSTFLFNKASMLYLAEYGLASWADLRMCCARRWSGPCSGLEQGQQNT